MTMKDQIEAILNQKFSTRHINSTLNHHRKAVEKYENRDWDGVAQYAGKFVESVAKTLGIFCGKKLHTGRKFKAGLLLIELQQLNSKDYDDVIRIVIPKGCLFVYEVVNNRGGRHDSHEIDANEMDMGVVMPIISWVLAEVIRLASTDKDTEEARKMVESLTKKSYPHFEEINGRIYVNVKDRNASKVALLLLYQIYPLRILRQTLVDLTVRNGFSKGAANTAVSRLKNSIDDEDGNWMLRSTGRQKAEKLIESCKN